MRFYPHWRLLFDLGREGDRCQGLPVFVKRGIDAIDGLLATPLLKTGLTVARINVIGLLRKFDPIHALLLGYGDKTLRQPGSQYQHEQIGCADSYQEPPEERAFEDIRESH